MSSDGSIAVPLMFAVFGLVMIYPFVKNHLKPAPSFEADANGFSVMGKPKRSWTEFRGVKVNTIYLWFVPISRSLIIKTGKNVLGGRVQVNPAYLSGSAKEMASEIANYAQAVKALPAHAVLGALLQAEQAKAEECVEKCQVPPVVQPNAESLGQGAQHAEPVFEKRSPSRNG